MTTIYVKSLSSDFSGNLQSDQLHEEITNEAGIGSTLLGITISGDDVSIIFDSALPTEQQTTLDNVIAAHSPNIITANQVSNITILPKKISSEIYYLVGTFNFAGTKNTYNVSNIKIISFMDSGGTSYYVRLWDFTNENLIAEANFNNTTEELLDFGIITNLPYNESIFEVHVKTENSSATVTNLIVYHD